jgi:hypothetical protein
MELLALEKKNESLRQVARETLELEADDRPRIVYALALTFKMLYHVHEKALKQQTIVKSQDGDKTEKKKWEPKTAQWYLQLHRLCMSFIHKYLIGCASQDAIFSWFIDNSGNQVTYDRFAPDVVASMLDRTAFALLPQRLVTSQDLVDWSTNLSCLRAALGQDLLVRILEDRQRLLAVCSTGPFLNDRRVRYLERDYTTNNGWLCLSDAITVELSQDDPNRTFSDVLQPNSGRKGRFDISSIKYTDQPFRLLDRIGNLPDSIVLILETDALLAWLDSWSQNNSTSKLLYEPPKSVHELALANSARLTNDSRDFIRQRLDALQAIIKGFLVLYDITYERLGTIAITKPDRPVSMIDYLGSLEKQLEAKLREDDEEDILQAANIFSSWEQELQRNLDDFAGRMGATSTYMEPKVNEKKQYLAEMKKITAEQVPKKFLFAWG